MWEQLRILWYQGMSYLDTVSLGWYALAAIAVTICALLLGSRFTPNGRSRFGDKDLR